MSLPPFSQEDLPELALIPGGSFVMGSDDDPGDSRPAREVHVGEFLIGVRPVSQAEYSRFIRETGHRAPGVYEVPLVASAGGPEREESFRRMCEPYGWCDGDPPRSLLAHPVTLVRYEDAVEYCHWLSGVTGRAVRLPSDEEWEKAARGGVDGRRYPWGDHLDRSMANFLADPAQRSRCGTTAPGTHPPNGYGLYDMVGNVWEWVLSTGSMRTLRGGSWLVADVRMLACSHRHLVPPDTYSYAIGFRIACSPG